MQIEMLIFLLGKAEMVRSVRSYLIAINLPPPHTSTIFKILSYIPSATVKGQ